MTDFPDRLTHAEVKVLAMVESGLSNHEIAQSLSITVGTTKSHLHRAFEKLGARNRLDAIAKARSRANQALVNSLAP